jgi:small subunit ribosomal protein S4e
MAHLKRYMMPKAWPVPVKKEKFIIRPTPGPHPLKRCMPLRVVLRDVLGIAETASEARQILNAGKVLIDKKVRKDPKFPVGLMDIIEIPDVKKQFKMSINNKGIFVDKIKAEEAGKKLCMIIGKKTLKKGIEQLNLHDGRNLLLDKGKNSYKVGDSVEISLPGGKIVNHYKLEKGGPAFIFSGKNMGASGKITSVNTKKSMTETSTVTIKSAHKEIETLKDYVFAGDAGIKADK